MHVDHLKELERWNQKIFHLHNVLEMHNYKSSKKGWNWRKINKELVASKGLIVFFQGDKGEGERCDGGRLNNQYINMYGV